MKFHALMLLLMFGTAQAADVYKWVGPDGRVVFGDKPPTDAKTEKLEIRTFSDASDVTTDDSAPVAGNVVMLSTTWCGVCKRAKQYFVSQGIAFSEYDIEKSDQGRAEYKRLKGRGVPIILVGNQRMDGFSVEKFEQMRKGSAQ